MAQYRADTLGPNAAFMDNGGAATTEIGVTTPSAALATNDTLDLVRIAAGTKLCELLIWNGDLDTGTTLQIKIGYRSCNTGDSARTPADDDDFFVAAGATTWQAAVLGSAPTRYAFVPTQFDKDVYVTATVTASATGVSGSPTITAMASGIARGVK